SRPGIGFLQRAKNPGSKAVCCWRAAGLEGVEKLQAAQATLAVESIAVFASAFAQEQAILVTSTASTADPGAVWPHPPLFKCGAASNLAPFPSPRAKSGTERLVAQGTGQAHDAGARHRPAR